MVVSMVRTVEAGEVTEVGGTLIGGDGTFPVLGDSGNVVIVCGKHPVAEVIHHEPFVHESLNLSHD